MSEEFIKEYPETITCKECHNICHLNDDKYYECDACGAQWDINVLKQNEASSKNTNIRISYYGGIGQMTHTWGPGAGTAGYNKNSKGMNVNNLFPDIGLDGRFGPSRKNFQFDPNRNMEKMLEPQHKYNEDNKIPYNLDPKERTRLKIMQEVHRREQFYKQVADSMDKNSVKYIQKNFHPKPEHMVTMENLLVTRHKIKNEKHQREDDVPAQIKPERYHPVACADLTLRLADTYIQHGLNTIFDPPSEDDDETRRSDPYNIRDIRYKNPQLGETPVLTKGSEMDQYLNDIAFGPSSYDNPGAHQETMAYDHPGPDEYGYNQAPTTEIDTPSQININDTLQNLSDEDSPFLSLEQKMDSLNKPKTPDSLPTDKNPFRGWPLSYEDQDEERNNQTANPYRHPDMTSTSYGLQPV
jgi:hypothetical protein